MKVTTLNVIRHTTRLDQMRHFYGELLGFTVKESWDTSPTNRGTVYSLGLDADAGTIEAVYLGEDVATHGGKPVNLDVGIHVDDVRAWHDALVERGVTIARGLESQDWGTTSFGVDDPGGLRLWFIEWHRDK